MKPLKRAVKALLPDPVVQRIQNKLATRASRRTKPIELERVQLIREASLEELSEPSYLEADLLPKLGPHGGLTPDLPASLHRHTGQGLRYCQYPNQFSKYLVALSNHRIESYLEIGVRHGGTFVITVEYLSRFHPLKEAVAVDIVRIPGLRPYRKMRPGVTLMRADSQGEAFQTFVRDHDPFDLVLIDGDHSEEACRRDFETVRDRARIVVFHDIVPPTVPGVVHVWREVMATHADRYDFLEFTDQYSESEGGMGGIGVALSRS